MCASVCVCVGGGGGAVCEGVGVGGCLPDYEQGYHVHTCIDNVSVIMSQRLREHSERGNHKDWSCMEYESTQK